MNRFLNGAFALVVLAAFSPLWLLIALAIVLESPGPVFFRPERLGKHQKRIRIYKFRTMALRVEPGSTSSTRTSSAKASARSAEYRVTRVGALLQRFSLDEVPQLLNVLSGQMRIVGPRPEHPEWASAYYGKHHELSALQPGISGSATLTLFDEARLLQGVRDRTAAYAQDVLPLKLSGDRQFLRPAAVYTSIAVLMIVSLRAIAVSTRTMSYFGRRILKVLADGLVVVCAVLAAHLARFGPERALEYLPDTLSLLVPLVTFRLFTLYGFGVYRAYWRYTSMRDLTRLAAATTAGSVLFGTLLYLFNWSPAAYPRSIFFIEWSLSTLGLIGIRGLRAGSRRLMHSRLVMAHERTRVLIYGAGDVGASLAASLLAHPDERYPVAFIDDNAAKCGAMVHGIPVLGSGAMLKSIVETLDIDEVILAIPTASGEQLRNIIFRCEELPCRLTTLPSLKEILAGQHTNRVREVRVEDLLDREAARVDVEAISELLHGQRILITGAGGSIGSELCRQIIAFQPEEVILLGHGENSVFEMQQELSESFGLQAHAVIADIQDRPRLNRIFRTYRPTIVFHAAAHKHVPLMEQNPEEAIKNNVLGTLNLAEVAVSNGTQRFLMVSSDKAVNPTSVMGATKRVAEMIVQAMACDPEVTTKFTAVRFGNVLGSRGSLIPVLRKQIARGGPVTITHPDMVRYFMTIPEAVQLMLQACSMGEQGEVFVLDMGEPVKVIDLARNLIRLSGLVLGKDIEIVYTGIRPGEKLYEELLTHSEGASATKHSQVFMARSTPPDPEALASAIARLESAALAGDQNAIRDTLADLVPSYGPKTAGVTASAHNGIVESAVEARRPESSQPAKRNAYPAGNGNGSGHSSVHAPVELNGSGHPPTNPPPDLNGSGHKRSKSGSNGHGHPGRPPREDSDGYTANPGLAGG